MQEILGEKVYRQLQDIPSPETIDILDVFRRAEDLDPHLPDILELKPKVLFQRSPSAIKSPGLDYSMILALPLPDAKALSMSS